MKTGTWKRDVSGRVRPHRVASFLYFVRHAMRSSPVWLRVIAPSYYRSYYRDTEFYDLIVAADSCSTRARARCLPRKALHPHDKSFKGGRPTPPSPSLPLALRLTSRRLALFDPRLNFERNFCYAH